MATVDAPADNSGSEMDEPEMDGSGAGQPARHDLEAGGSTPSRRQAKSQLESLLGPLASLRLTVALFAASLFIVLAGTFAQTRADIWQVIDLYFRFDVAKVFTSSFPFVDVSALFVWIDGALFFPPAFAPDGPPAWATKVGFPFPKGWTIGVVLILNLLAAHAVRFKVQAKGLRLINGLIVTLLGAGFTYLVVAAGGSNDGFQSDTLISFDTIWYAVVASLAVIGCACGWGVVTLGKERSEERFLMLASGLGSLTLFVYLVGSGADARLEDAYMRILWHLIKATLAGLTLLVGCVLLFKKRAGIVLLHAGVSLMMVGEIMVGLQATESKMTLVEGRGSNFASDTRDWEIVVVDPSPADGDDGVIESVVSSDLIDLSSDEPVALPDLPFSIKVREFKPNSFVQQANKKDIKRGLVVGTAGVGRSNLIREMPVAKGTDSTLDMPSAYVDVVDTETGETKETLLLSTFVDEQNITIDDKVYQFALRFKRTYKPYTIYLNDMVKEDYVGTSTPRDFSAYITLSDPTTGVVSDRRIWMNNPLRYAGETFYQADYLSRDAEGTGIQIVTNQGWMIPYVACMIVAVGMIAQFGQSILRFLDRRRSGRLPAAPVSIAATVDPETGKRGSGPIKRDGPKGPTMSSSELLAIAAAVLVAGSMIAVKILPPSVEPGEPDLPSFAALPIVKGGRVKPIDTLARNALLVLSDRQTAKRPHPDPEKAAKGKTISVDATHWLLDVISQATREQTPAERAAQIAAAREAGSEVEPPPEPVSIAGDYLVFRIENLDVIEFMGLPRRQGLVYSMNELQPGLPKLNEQIEQARKLEMEDLTFFQRKLVDLNKKRNIFDGLQFAYRVVPPPRESSKPEDIVRDLQRRAKQIGEFDLTRSIPVISDSFLIEPSDPGWLSLVEARFISELEVIRQIGAAAADEEALARIEQIETVLRGKLDDASRKRFEAETKDLKAGIERNKESRKRYGGVLKAVKAYDAMLSTWASYSAIDRDLEAATYGESADEQLAAGIQSDRDAAGEAFSAAVNQFKVLVNTELTNVKADSPAASAAESYGASRLGFEAFFNRFAPFHMSWILYIIAAVLTSLSLLIFPREMRIAALATIVLTFALHTFALWARINISGRPPVTNLYSSAVFIGWAAVLFGIGLEWIYKMGVGNIVAATSGILTLRIAHVLAADGDTFEVLQAVLDTQFWLATHVVTVTLGYSATFVAGLLAAVGICRGLKVDERTADDRKTLARMTYGVTCFAMLFSFVGTVLGGLWADDSWGRFWGWDPKENGALMIVLANALVLHARWGKMIAERGLFVLAVLSNIVVAWSWFGTNELGVGLHTYGFTEGRLRMLAFFAASQIILAALAFFPTFGKGDSKVAEAAALS